MTQGIKFVILKKPKTDLCNGVSFYKNPMDF